MTMRKVAIVTGANRGIGKAIVQKLAKDYQQSEPLIIYLTSRTEESGHQVLEELSRELPPNVELKHAILDIVQPSSINSLVETLKQQNHVPIDILVNNAGIAFKGAAFDEHVAKTTLETNYFATLDMCLAFLPLMKPQGRIINVSSVMGQLKMIQNPELKQTFLRAKTDLSLTELNQLMQKFIKDVATGKWEQEGWPKQAYGISKAGLTAMTYILARSKQVMDHQIMVVSCHPGWVKTDMGGQNAPLSVEEGAETPVWLAYAPVSQLQNGEFYSDKGLMNW